MFETKSIQHFDETQRENHRHLEAILNEQSIWHYRVQSTLLVASSALLALSSSPLPASNSNHCILQILYCIGLVCNSLQLLASCIVLGILLKNYSQITNTASSELLSSDTHEKTIVFRMRKRVRYLFRLALVASFAFFAATISILVLCRMLVVTL